MSAKVVENYSLLEVIGAGQYGKVYKALNIKTNSLVAIKVVKIEKFKEVPKVNMFGCSSVGGVHHERDINLGPNLKPLCAQIHRDVEEQ